MTIFWPADLPQHVAAGGYVEGMADVVETFPTDAGPPKTRKRVTRAWRPIQATLPCTREQAELFREFYEDTLYGGLFPFMWVNPRTQGSAFFRFRKPPPVLTPTPGDLVSVRMNLWQTSMLAGFRADSTLLDASSTTHTADEMNTW